MREEAPEKSAGHTKVRGGYGTVDNGQSRLQVVLSTHEVTLQRMGGRGGGKKKSRTIKVEHVNWDGTIGIEYKIEYNLPFSHPTPNYSGYIFLSRPPRSTNNIQDYLPARDLSLLVSAAARSAQSPANWPSPEAST